MIVQTLREFSGGYRHRRLSPGTLRSPLGSKRTLIRLRWASLKSRNAEALMVKDRGRPGVEIAAVSSVSVARSS